MDNYLYILLLPIVFILGFANSENLCHGDNCNTTETDETFADESEIDLFSLDADLRELRLNDCSNLTILDFTPNLRTLELFNCSQYNINITDLRAVANLSTLRLQGGRLTKLDNDQFIELPHLEVLELGSNKINEVSRDAFKGLSQLLLLTLNDNNIILLHKNLFQPLPELRHLDLSNNRINGLPEEIFANNPKLQVFCVRGGHFLSVSPKTLRPLRNLIFLDLSNNYFRDLQLPSAESICLVNSGLHYLRIEGNVSKLQASYNFFESLNIENKAAVTELDLHENGLETGVISNTLQGMWRLQYLDISKNMLNELPLFTKDKLGEVFLLPNLRFANISKNWVKHLRADSPVLSPSLTLLDLSYNKIRSIEPHTFSMASQLQGLYIQGNLLVDFQFELFLHQHRGLREVALYNKEFSQDTYEKITKYFAMAGVLVLEENKKATLKIDTFNNNPFRVEMLIQQLLSKRQHIQPGRRQSTELSSFKKGSTWKILILFILLTVLFLNAILILRRLHSSGKTGWRRKQVSIIKFSFLNKI